MAYLSYLSQAISRVNYMKNLGEKNKELRIQSDLHQTNKQTTVHQLGQRVMICSPNPSPLPGHTARLRFVDMYVLHFVDIPT